MLFARYFLTDQKIYRSDQAPEKPTVSVILPTYARFKTGQLQRAVDSVLSQTFGDLELLIMDDGSRDGTFDYVEKCRERDPRVIHVRHDRNCALPGLRTNEGIELARGTYVAFQFDDDVWRSNALQSLTDCAARHERDAVFVGTSTFHTPNGLETVPTTELNHCTLFERNRFANNSVLIPRHLFDQYGLYDGHIVLRRSCDWDLWLRLVKHVPFYVVNEIIADIYTFQTGSLGVTTPWDLDLFRFIHDIPRNHLLTPGRWQDQEVDAFKVGDVAFQGERLRRVYEEHVVAFYLSFRHQLPLNTGFPAHWSPRRRTDVALIHENHDASDYTHFYNYDEVASKRDTVKVRYEHPQHLTAQKIKNNRDLMMLVRRMDGWDLDTVDASRQEGLPIAYFLDDDLIHAHEMDDYRTLHPGSPGYKSMMRMLSAADAVWVTSETIARAVHPSNRRTVPHGGCVAPECLPAHTRQRDPGRPLKIGYVGSNSRREEFALLWDALIDIAEEFGDQVEFEFWGIDISDMPALCAPVKTAPFTAGYFQFLRRLRQSEFDILLVPLLDQPRFRQAKSMNKYGDVAVAGAVGIFSDVPAYAALPVNDTCLKAANTPEEWRTAIRQAITMAPEQFDRLRSACLAHVRESFTSTALIDQYEAAWRATEFHALTRGMRLRDGRPRIIYFVHSAFLGGAEIVTRRRFEIVRRYGIEPILVMPETAADTDEGTQSWRDAVAAGMDVAYLPYRCFEEPLAPSQYKNDTELQAISAFLEKVQPALVHTVTFIPSVGQACQRLGIPHVCALYQIRDDFTWQAPDAATYKHCQVVHSDCMRYMRRWGDLLHVERSCVREVVPATIFERGRRKLTALRNQAPEQGTESGTPVIRIAVLGTLQPRKGQLEAITAVGQLLGEGFRLRLDLYGYSHFYPQYLAACQRQILQDNSQHAVVLRGFMPNVSDELASIDILLCSSTAEGIPGSIREAFAAGLLVVSTPAGGIPEVVVNNVTGILSTGFGQLDITDALRRALSLSPEQRHAILHQARRVALSDFHPHRAANDLLDMYVRALELAGAGLDRQHHTDGSLALEQATGLESGPVKMIYNHPPQGHHPLRPRLRYRICPERRHWSGLDVLIGTHQAPAKGTIALIIRGAKGRVLRRADAQLDGARDNDWLSFRFDAIANSHQAEFTIELCLRARRHEARVSLFEGSAIASPPLLKRVQNRIWPKIDRSDLSCRLLFGPSK